MCGRITQKSNPNQLGLKIVNLIEPLYADNTPPRYNGAPGQEHWVIRQNPKTGERTLDRLWWGLIPYWVKDEKGGRKPINAKAETIATLPTFRDAYEAPLPPANRQLLRVEGDQGREGQAAVRHRHEVR